MTRPGMHTTLISLFKIADKPMHLDRLRAATCFGLICLMFCAMSCSDQITWQERLVSIKHQAWTHAYQPWVHLTIEDSTMPYQIFAVIRHTQQFKYDNLLLRYGYIAPGDSAIFHEVNLPLASGGKWLGDTLGTVIETRIRLSATPRLLPKGDNVFVLGHLMPDEPLTGILQVGIRIESAGPGSGLNGNNKANDIELTTIADTFKTPSNRSKSISDSVQIK